MGKGNKPDHTEGASSICSQPLKLGPHQSCNHKSCFSAPFRAGGCLNQEHLRLVQVCFHLAGSHPNPSHLLTALQVHISSAGVWGKGELEVGVISLPIAPHLKAQDDLSHITRILSEHSGIPECQTSVPSIIPWTYLPRSTGNTAKQCPKS